MFGGGEISGDLKQTITHKSDRNKFCTITVVVETKFVKLSFEQLISTSKYFLLINVHNHWSWQVE